MYSRNVPLLSLSQALGSAGITLMVLLGGIIGSDIAPVPALATLPISIQVLGVACSTIPASLLMRRFGRRRAFVAASLSASMAALLAAYAVISRNFALFCTATFFTGMNGAFVQQYRFAAGESVEPRFASRAVSFVLVGGIFAGVLGPELAKHTKDLIAAGTYAGSFISLAGLYILAAMFLSTLQDIRPQASAGSGVERPLRQIAMQPVYLVAVLAGMVGYGVMSFTMTATPLQLNKISGFSLEETAWVIQSHVVAMFLPSLFTGYIIERLGVLRVMFVGVLLLGITVTLGVFGEHLLHYWWALVLLGVGWNFLYVGGTVLLTQSYRPVERFKAQAANEFATFGVQAVASLSAGTVIFSAGWVVLNMITLPFLLVVLAALLILRVRLNRDQRETEAPVVTGVPIK